MNKLKKIFNKLICKIFNHKIEIPINFISFTNRYCLRCGAKLPEIKFNFVNYILYKEIFEGAKSSSFFTNEILN